MNKLTKSLKYLEGINTTVVNLLILAIGIVCLLASYLFDNNVKTILISVGCSLIASAIVMLLSSRYLIRRNKVKEIIDIWGLENIYHSRQEMNVQGAQVSFAIMEKNLDIIAFGLQSFRDAKSHEVEEKVKNGLKIRILTPNPYSPFVIQREKEENQIEGQIKNTILNLEAWIHSLQDIAIDSANIQLKYYNSLPLDFYFRQDDFIYIGPYQYGIGSQQTISYEFRGASKAFKYYSEYFEKLWNDTEFCSPEIPDTRVYKKA